MLYVKNFFATTFSFCKQFLAFTVHIDWCWHFIHKHSCGSQHISVLTTCTYMTTSGMHRRPFESRHLVFTSKPFRNNMLGRGMFEWLMSAPKTFSASWEVVDYPSLVLAINLTLYWAIEPSTPLARRGSEDSISSARSDTVSWLNL